MTFGTPKPSRCPGITRRHILQAGVAGTLGLSLSRLWQARANAPGGSSTRAKSCIFIYQVGAPPQQDMWDLKPSAPDEYRGEFNPIATNVPGIQVGELLPRLAQIADKYAIVRSCSHDDVEHNSACYAHMTGRMHPRKGQIVPPSPDDFPPYGAVLSLLRPTQQPVPNWVTMPDVLLNNSIPYPSQNAGFLGGNYDPFGVRTDPNRPDFNIQGLTLTQEMASSLPGRTSLLKQINQQAGHLQNAAVQTMDASYQRAFTLLSSPQTREAFDLVREPVHLRDHYGRHTWGQSLLLARRLVEAGVPLVTVNLSRNGSAIWDTHGNNFTALRNDLLPQFDRGFSALLEDLDDRGLLSETLVVAGGEFGRTPRINAQAGRDHWPWVYTTILAGGGIRGGQVYGSSDRLAAYPSSNPVSPGDLAATVYHCLGLAATDHIHDRLGRPYPIALGQVINGLF